MKWRKYPHLFANGAFLLRSKDYDIHQKVFRYMPFNIIGWDESKKEFLVSQNNGSWKHIDECTLIARKIEDMTDEESYKAIGEYDDKDYTEWKAYEEKTENGFFDNIRMYIEDEAKSGRLEAHVFIHLLSIGVYPFDQSHFEDGTVIDVNLSKPTQHTEK